MVEPYKANILVLRIVIRWAIRVPKIIKWKETMSSEDKVCERLAFSSTRLLRNLDTGSASFET